MNGGSGVLAKTPYGVNTKKKQAGTTKSCRGRQGSLQVPSILLYLQFATG
jgi:hypothetical protein